MRQYAWLNDASQQFLDRDYLRAGQTVGRVGSTGRSTGAHLHYGTYLRWNPKDPMALYRGLD